MKHYIKVPVLKEQPGGPYLIDQGKEAVEGGFVYQDPRSFVSYRSFYGGGGDQGGSVLFRDNGRFDTPWSYRELSSAIKRSFEIWASQSEQYRNFFVGGDPSSRRDFDWAMLR